MIILPMLMTDYSPASRNIIRSKIGNTLVKRVANINNNVRKQCRQGNFHNVVCIDLVILLLYFAFLNMFNVFLTFIPRSPLVLSNNDLLDSDIRGLSRVE